MESGNMNYSNRTQPTLKIPHSLLSKNITVYRGGPESKTGKLMDVKPDYLVIYADNKIIYYRSEHIKSITEDSKTNAAQTNNAQEENPFFYQEDNFLSLLTNFLNKKIQIDQGGPDSKQGKLLEVGSDYLVLSTDDDGIVYYYLPHIKSIMELESNENDGEEDSVESSTWVMEEKTEDPVMTNFLRGSDFNHLCSLLTHNWVSINRKGPEALEGIFVDNSEGFFTLANNQELYRINPFHVRNISIGPKGAMKQQQNNNQQEEQTDNIMDESSSENFPVTSSITSGQRESSGIWGESEDRESSENRSTSRGRRTSRRRRTSSSSNRTSRRRRTSSSNRTSRRRRTSSSNRTSRRRRTSSSYRTSRRRRTSSSNRTNRRRRSSRRRNRRTSSSSSRTTRRLESIVRSVSYDWRPLS
ncbi:spore coat protein CotH [Bacillus sp. APMAM]|nr:spore coat protein CotH [Bacillus sp. APMAM]